MTMPKSPAIAPCDEQLTYECGGWITWRVPRPDMSACPASLLAASAVARPGNSRFAIAGNQVYLLGELRDADGLTSLEEAKASLLATVDDPLQELSEFDMAIALGETGCEWLPSQDDRKQWQAAVDDRRGCRCNLTAEIIQGGVEFRAVPAAWEFEVGTTSETAILRFLVAAQGRIRFARFNWLDGKASVASFAAATRMDVELADSVAAIVAACQLVWREVAALANTAVAEAYMQPGV